MPRLTHTYTLADICMVAARSDRTVEATHVEGERSVGFQLGCDSDVPDARLEGSARPTTAQEDRCTGIGCPGALERPPAAACAGQRVAVDPDSPHARGIPGSRVLREPPGGWNSALPQSWLRRVRDQ